MSEPGNAVFLRYASQDAEAATSLAGFTFSMHRISFSAP